MVLAFEKLNGKSRPQSGSALSRNFSTVEFHELLRESKPNSGPSVPARSGHVDLKEALENSVRHVGGKSDPVVLDRNNNTILDVTNIEPDVPIVRRELRSVRQKVDKNALDSLQIARNDGALDVRLEVKRDRLSLGKRPNLRKKSAEVLHQVVLVDAQPKTRLLELRKVQKIRDKLEQLDPAAVHRLKGGTLRVGGRSVLRVEHELQGREDHCKRCLELVGDVGKELRLRPVELTQLLVRNRQIDAHAEVGARQSLIADIRRNCDP